MKLKMETFYAVGYKRKTSEIWTAAHKTVNRDRVLVAARLATTIRLGSDQMEYALLRIDSHGADNITHIKSGKLPGPQMNINYWADRSIS